VSTEFWNKHSELVRIIYKEEHENLTLSIKKNLLFYISKRMKRSKVLVAMSGGVDSSVAAALLKEKGYEVLGISINFSPISRKCHENEKVISNFFENSCRDAHRVAKVLGIPHGEINLRSIFEEKVIEDFCQEYSQGHTPNPCIRCNQYVKFEILLKEAQRYGADFLATGHYARIIFDPEKERYFLKKGKDKEKDQSYFLYILTQRQLASVLFPLGNLKKEEVRSIARKLNLPVVRRPESQEICFIPDNDYVSFLKKRIPEAFYPGPIINLEGRKIGQHKGIVHFTVGQRRGIGIAAPCPLYVIGIIKDRNTIVVGNNDDLYKKELKASHINWIAMDKLTEPLSVKAKIRYKSKETRAVCRPLDSGKIQIEFEKPQRAITPGQSVVFYNGDFILGGGIIEEEGIFNFK